MTERKIGVGDVVAVTARVTEVRGDGSFGLEPLGFDFDIEGVTFVASEVEVIHYTVDEPTLVHHTWSRGEELFDVSGERFVYHKHLGQGLHLLNRADLRRQDVTDAWMVKDTRWVASLTSEPPELSGG